MKKLPAILIYMAILCGIAVFVFGCSPKKRLNRLVKHHPELKHTDTVFVPRVVITPGYTVYASVKKNTTTGPIGSLMSTLKGKIDTVTIEKIKTVYRDKKCLTGPKTFLLPRGGTATLTEVGGQFNLSVSQPPFTQTITIPIAATTITAKPQYSWRMFAFGVLLGFIVALVLVIIYFRKGLVE